MESLIPPVIYSVLVTMICKFELPWEGRQRRSIRKSMRFWSTRIAPGLPCIRTIAGVQQVNRGVVRLQARWLLLSIRQLGLVLPRCEQHLQHSRSTKP